MLSSFGVRVTRGGRNGDIAGGRAISQNSMRRRRDDAFKPLIDSRSELIRAYDLFMHFICILFLLIFILSSEQKNTLPYEYVPTYKGHRTFQTVWQRGKKPSTEETIKLS